MGKLKQTFVVYFEKFKNISVKLSKNYKFHKLFMKNKKFEINSVRN